MAPPSVPLDAIRQPAVLYDADGRIAAVNDLAGALAGRSLVGLTAVDLAGIFDVRSPEGAPLTDAGSILSRALAGEEILDLPLIVTLHDGRTLEILATASPVRDSDTVTGALVLWQDVTARAKAEEAVQTLLRASPDITLLLAPDGTVLALNKTTASAFGRSPAELVGTNIWEVMPPDAVAFRRDRFAAALESGRPSRFEESRNGRWYDTIVEPIVSGSGEVSRIAIMSRDITDRKRAEKALLESEEKYRALIETNADFVWEMDARGRYTYCSPQMEALWGIRPEEMLGRTPFDLMPPGGRERALAAFTEMASAPGGFSGLDMISYDGRGRLIALEISGVPFFSDGALLGFRGVTRDVTERKRAEEALRESEERLRLAQENAGIAIWDRDVATNRVIVAPAFIRRYLLEPESMATYADWERFIHPDDRARLEAMRQGALGAGEPLELEFRIVIPSGEVRWIQFKGKGMADEQGALARVIGVVIDVTDQKRAEEALAESEAAARSFFANMVDACAICEMVVDERGEPADIRLVEVNPAFERTLCLPADLIIGQTAFMILPTLHREWLDLFLEVSRDHGVVAIEEPFPALGRRFHVTGFPVRNGRVAVVFRDVTEPREAVPARSAVDLRP